MQVISDIDNIPTGSSESATITAFVTDASNVPLADAEVTITSDGGLLQNLSPLSDSNGEASATLRVVNDFRNQAITVEVSSDVGVGTAVVQATGSEVDIAGSLDLSMGDDTQLVARLTSGVGEPIPNTPVEINSSAGHRIDVDSRITDIDGLVEFSVMDVTAADTCLLYTSPSPRDGLLSRMPSSA